MNNDQSQNQPVVVPSYHHAQSTHQQIGSTNNPRQSIYHEQNRFPGQQLSSNMPAQFQTVPQNQQQHEPTVFNQYPQNQRTQNIEPQNFHQTDQHVNYHQPYSQPIAHQVHHAGPHAGPLAGPPSGVANMPSNVPYNAQPNGPYDERLSNQQPRNLNAKRPPPPGISERPNQINTYPQNNQQGYQQPYYTNNQNLHVPVNQPNPHVENTVIHDQQQNYRNQFPPQTAGPQSPQNQFPPQNTQYTHPGQPPAQQQINSPVQKNFYQPSSYPPNNIQPPPQQNGQYNNSSTTGGNRYHQQRHNPQSNIQNHQNYHNPTNQTPNHLNNNNSVSPYQANQNNFMGNPHQGPGVTSGPQRPQVTAPKNFHSNKQNPSPYHIPPAQQHNRQSLFHDVDDLIKNFDADLHISNSEPVNLDECVGPIYGKCKWFNVIKGFGFITPNVALPPPDGKNPKDIFVYQNVIKMPGFRSLREGETVECYVKKSHLGWEAVQITGPEGLDCEGTERFKKKKPDRCYNCGDLGHHAKECKFPPLPKRCHFCKAENHLVADCPFKGPVHYNPVSYSSGVPNEMFSNDKRSMNLNDSQGFHNPQQNWPNLTGGKNIGVGANGVQSTKNYGGSFLSKKTQKSLFDSEKVSSEGVTRMRFHSSGIIPGRNSSIFSQPQVSDHSSAFQPKNNTHINQTNGDNEPNSKYSNIIPAQVTGISNDQSTEVSNYSKFQAPAFEADQAQPKYNQRLSSSSPSALFPKPSETTVNSLFTGENARKLWQNDGPIQKSSSNSIFGGGIQESNSKQQIEKSSDKHLISNIFSDQFSGNWDK